jgi:uncharacterized membrane protein YphA (DoxX/SURF4 family)
MRGRREKRVITGWSTIDDWLNEPVAELRLEIVRAIAPLAILGFMSGRLAHADEWIGDGGFRVPDLGGKEAWYQPLFVPALPSGAAWAVAALMVAAGLACSAGYKTRPSAVVFAATLAFVAVSDRLSAFTVSKLSPAVMLAVAAGPSGSRFGVDAWLARRRGEAPAPARRSLGNVRFLQLLVVTIYSASGIAKARGDWLSVPLVLWSHLHDSYQTWVAFELASVLPAWAWTTFQGMVLSFELFAPLWFGLARTRPWAMLFGVGMHAMIGLMFGPVVWFALLMATLLVAGYLPDPLVARLDEALSSRREAGSPAPRRS